MKIRILIAILSMSTLVSLSSCDSVGGSSTGINLFSVEQDVQLGQQTVQQIQNNPQEFPVLPERGNEEIYQYIRDITNRILATGKVEYANEFEWRVKIIDQDEVLNAFAAPGGYIYVYTGLIKFLDSEDQLAGVMGHEIAHAARRHSTSQMTKIYGLSALSSLLTGNASPGMLEQIALSIAGLSFSRSHENDADAMSVIYLCETDYNAAGAAGFFKKMEGRETPPEFLSTHPNPGDRVNAIESRAREMGCTNGKTFQERYERMKRLI